MFLTPNRLAKKIHPSTTLQYLEMCQEVKNYQERTLRVMAKVPLFPKTFQELTAQKSKKREVLRAAETK